MLFYLVDKKKFVYCGIIKQQTNNKMKNLEKARRIHRKIEDRIFDLQLLKGGFIMTNKTFKTMLKEHPELKREFEILKNRSWCIKRFIFLNA